jgi:PAS domain-containing protein
MADRDLAWLPNFVVAVLFTIVRFTVGWYIARVFCAVRGICATVRIAGGDGGLYTRLANAVVLLRRERTDRLAIFNTVADDYNGITENLNPQAGRLFGYSPEEVMGR